MDLSRLHSIINDYKECHLISLTEWKSAHEIQPHDHGGPYAVLQEGYDPTDVRMTPDEFLLGKSGDWISTSLFFRMPTDLRREEFIFGTAAEVIELLTNLPGEANILRNAESLTTHTALQDDEDDLSQAFRKATSDRNRSAI